MNTQYQYNLTTIEEVDDFLHASGDDIKVLWPGELGDAVAAMLDAMHEGSIEAPADLVRKCFVSWAEDELQAGNFLTLAQLTAAEEDGQEYLKFEVRLKRGSVCKEVYIDADSATTYHGAMAKATELYACDGWKAWGVQAARDECGRFYRFPREEDIPADEYLVTFTDGRGKCVNGHAWARCHEDAIHAAWLDLAGDYQDWHVKQVLRLSGDD